MLCSTQYYDYVTLSMRLFLTMNRDKQAKDDQKDENTKPNTHTHRSAKKIAGLKYEY